MTRQYENVVREQIERYRERDSISKPDAIVKVMEEYKASVEQKYKKYFDITVPFSSAIKGKDQYPSSIALDIAGEIAIEMNGTRVQSICRGTARVRADEKSTKFLCDYISSHKSEKGIAA